MSTTPLSLSQTKVTIMAYLVNQAMGEFVEQKAKLRLVAKLPTVQIRKCVAHYDSQADIISIPRMDLRKLSGAVCVLVHESVHAIVAKYGLTPSQYLRDDVKLTRTISNRCKEAYGQVGLHCIEEVLTSCIEFVVAARTSEALNSEYVEYQPSYVSPKILMRWYRSGTLMKVYRKFMTQHHRRIITGLANKLIAGLSASSTGLSGPEFRKLVNRVMWGKIQVQMETC